METYKESVSHFPLIDLEFHPKERKKERKKERVFTKIWEFVGWKKMV
jgi:hypothetical protein